MSAIPPRGRRNQWHPANQVAANQVAANQGRCESGPLRIRAGRVVCPAQGIDGPGEVLVHDGRIVNFLWRKPDDAPQGQEESLRAPDVSRVAIEYDFPDGILLPGLIDFHAHPARTRSVYGADVDRHLLPHGVTTVLSQGDAGADDCLEFLDQTIAACRTRVLLAINLSRVGESGGSTRLSNTESGGCFAELADADVGACLAGIEAGRPFIWGIAINVSRHACGETDPREVVARGLQVAERSGLPILYGMRGNEQWPFAEQMARLRRGDVVTYCFRSRPHTIVVNGRVHPAIRIARERGILFDVGHGRASFDFEVAEAAIRDGFPPDTISTDFQRGHVDAQPRHDLLGTMAKLMAAGMSESEAFAAVTARPAAALRRDGELGQIRVGAPADLVVLRASEGPFTWHDTSGGTRLGRHWSTLLTLRNGQVV